MSEDAGHTHEQAGGRSRLSRRGLLTAGAGGIAGLYGLNSSRALGATAPRSVLSTASGVSGACA